MSIRHNLFTTADSLVIAEIMAKIETYRTVTVLADRDADLHVGPDKWAPIAQRLIAHPEQFIGNYGKDSDPLWIAQNKAWSALKGAARAAGAARGALTRMCNREREA
jgi:hypothetical protein